ncbi:FG-GAP repeat domain-containing protein [Paenibacillus periandrae]|uniref:FG-GAP repeat domain-containing protein n=1 Tax=Paenibacillus periandrae TaxID=1761741 RepID=UPI001F09FB07|nr:VCBS repeat-containing protein [Paenibacillus periandrae]
MVNRLISTCLIVTSILWLGGCGMPASPIDLIKPPVSEGTSPKDKWSTTLRTLLPEGARLLASVHGNKGNGTVFGDMDGDGINEAIVVYEEDVLNEKKLKAALLKQYKEDWRIVWDTLGAGYGLDNVGFADVNKDGRPEVVLGWSLGDGGNGLDVYEWSNNTLKLSMKKGYHGHLDLDQIP